MNTLSQIVDFYNTNNITKLEKHKKIYETFLNNTKQFNNGILFRQFENTDGFGEVAFCWSWFLIVNEMTTNFKFLEIGVYKGKILAMIQLISNILNKQVEIFGVTPLDISTDKYSSYDNVDYIHAIKHTFCKSNLSFENTKIIKGFSQNQDVIEQANQTGQYDIIYIDGCHDYEIVCLDIQNYVKMLKVGGYLILDDASSLLEGSYGQFLGHYDVGKAINDVIDNDNRLVHLYAIGHNRIWKKQCV
jgi:hypothetical protein